MIGIKSATFCCFFFFFFFFFFFSFFRCCVCGARPVRVRVWCLNRLAASRQSFLSGTTLIKCPWIFHHWRVCCYVTHFWWSSFWWFTNRWFSFGENFRPELSKLLVRFVWAFGWALPLHRPVPKRINIHQSSAQTCQEWDNSENLMRFTSKSKNANVITKLCVLLI